MEGVRMRDEASGAKEKTGTPAGAFSPPPSAFILSIVVPCYNEAAVIRETHRRVSEAVARLDAVDVEVVYVDDGSTDETASFLAELSGADERVRVVRLSRNFGHQVAVTAGLEHARGDAVVIIDADLQDPPEVIPLMVERWRGGADVVYGEREQRAGETRFKRWTAKLFYRLMNRLSKVRMPLDAGDFRLLDRRVVEALLRMPERDRFLRGMVAWVGFRQIAVRYVRAPRFAGASKYPLFKMVRFAMDGVISFSLTPLRLAVWTGFVAIAVAFAGIVYAVLLRFFFDESHWVRGWASLFVATLFMGGVQLISLGIIGEYVGRIYGEVKQRPLYFVRERLGFETETRGGAVLDGRGQT